jgi:hypothetical protein
MQLLIGQSIYTSGVIDTNELEKVREPLLPLFQKTGPEPCYTVGVSTNVGGYGSGGRVTYRLLTWVGTVAWSLRREGMFGAASCEDPQIPSI